MARSHAKATERGRGVKRSEAGTSTLRHGWRPRGWQNWAALVAIAYAVISVPSVVGFWWPDGPNETQVRYAAFFDDNGLKRDVPVKRKVARANCWTFSQSRPTNPYAARCMSGHTILDPCELNLGQTAAACAGAPWDPIVLVKTSKASA